jgi:DNA-directed RNA polymerase specialized sigma24 family protein
MEAESTQSALIASPNIFGDRMRFDAEGSVTRWIGDLKRGDREAARLLWERYFGCLVRLARKKLPGAGRHGADADEEDVALSVLDSLCRGAEQGRFPKLADRDDLWGLLLVITARKAINQARRQGALKRGGGRVLAEAARVADGPDESGPMEGLGGIVGAEPSPEFAAMVAEQYRLLLEALGDDSLRRIALRKLEGYTGEEIAAELGCAPRTVANKLKIIRLKWGGSA